MGNRSMIQLRARAIPFIAAATLWSHGESDASRAGENAGLILAGFARSRRSFNTYLSRRAAKCGDVSRKSSMFG